LKLTLRTRRGPWSGLVPYTRTVMIKVLRYAVPLEEH
jgi:hypothetical protein